MSPELLLTFAFGVTFVGILLLVALRKDALDARQFFLLRVIMSLAAAAVAALIPGFINVDLNVPGFVVRAGGALAVFVIVYALNPKSIPKEEPSGSSNEDSK